MSGADLIAHHAAAPGDHRETHVTVSVLIKCLNEEKKVERAVRSAIHAIETSGFSGEIIVGDSMSEDKTLDLASTFPATVVQIADIQDRGCGAAVQLCYQFSKGEYVYLLDGDMALQPEFLKIAIEFLSRNRRVGGVAGLVVDEVCRNEIDAIRIRNKSAMRTGQVPHLNGGGLYRRSAIEGSGGYAADRNLRAFEEFELGLRLRRAGYQLVRLPAEAVRHNGHELTTLGLFALHWRSRRTMAVGVLLRGTLKTGGWREWARLLAHPLAIGTAWFLSLMALLLVPTAAKPAVVGALVTGLVVATLTLALRKRSLSHALTSLYCWHIQMLAIIAGAFYRRVDPKTPIRARVIQRKRLVVGEPRTGVKP